MEFTTEQIAGEGYQMQLKAPEETLQVDLEWTFKLSFLFVFLKTH